MQKDSNTVHGARPRHRGSQTAPGTKVVPTEPASTVTWNMEKCDVCWGTGEKGVLKKVCTKCTPSGAVSLKPGKNLARRKELFNCASCNYSVQRYTENYKDLDLCEECLANTYMGDVKCNACPTMVYTGKDYIGGVYCKMCSDKLGYLKTPHVVCIACNGLTSIRLAKPWYDGMTDRVRYMWPTHNSCVRDEGCPKLQEDDVFQIPCGGAVRKVHGILTTLCDRCDDFESTYYLSKISEAVAMIALKTPIWIPSSNEICDENEKGKEKIDDEVVEPDSSGFAEHLTVLGSSSVEMPSQPIVAISKLPIQDESDSESSSSDSDHEGTSGDYQPAGVDYGASMPEDSDVNDCQLPSPRDVVTPPSNNSFSMPDSDQSSDSETNTSEASPATCERRGFANRNPRLQGVYEFDYGWKKKNLKGKKSRIFGFKINDKYLADILPPPLVSGASVQPFATIGVFMHHCLQSLKKTVVLLDNPFGMKGIKINTRRNDLMTILPLHENAEVAVSGLLGNGIDCEYGFVVDYPEDGKFSHALSDLPFEYKLYGDAFCPHLVVGSMRLPVQKQMRQYVEITRCNEIRFVRYVADIDNPMSASLLDDIAGKFMGTDRVFVPNSEIADFTLWATARQRNQVLLSDLLLYMRRYYDKKRVAPEVAYARISVMAPYLMSTFDIEAKVREVVNRDAVAINHNNVTTIDSIVRSPYLSMAKHYLMGNLWLVPLALYMLMGNSKIARFATRFVSGAKAQNGLLVTTIVAFLLQTRKSVKPNSLINLKQVYEHIRHLYAYYNRFRALMSNSHLLRSTITLVVVLLQRRSYNLALANSVRLQPAAIFKIFLLFVAYYFSENRNAKAWFVATSLSMGLKPASFLGDLLARIWSKICNWWLNYTEVSGFNRHVDCSLMGWPIGNPRGFDVDQVLTRVKPSAVYNVCNDQKDIVPFTDKSTIYKDGEMHCKATFGVAMVMSVPARKMVSAPRNCNHNRMIGTINRGLADAKRFKPKSWKYVHDMLNTIVSVGKVRPAQFEVWLKRFPLNRQNQILKGKKQLEDGRWFVGDYMRNSMIKVEKQSFWEFGDEHLFDPRLIQGCTFKYQVATGPITYALTKALSGYLHERMIYACGLKGDDIGKLFDEWYDRIDNPILINGDFSRLDNTIRRDAYEFEKNAYLRLGVARKHIKALFKQRHLTRGVFKTGEFYQVPYTRCSGDGNTSVGNSLVCGAVFFTYFTLIGANFVVFVMGDDTYSMTDKYNHEECVNFITSLGLVPKLHPHRNKVKSEFLSARFWPSTIGTVLAPKPGRLLSRLGYTYRHVPYDQKYEFAKGVLLGVQRATQHVPLARAYVKRHLELFTGIQAKEIREMHSIDVSSTCEATVETLAMAAKLYDTTIDGILDAESVLESIKHPATVFEHDIINKAIIRDYSASLFKSGTGIFMQSMFDGLWEEAFKRISPHCAVLLVLVEALRNLATGYSMKEVIVIIAMHVVFYQFPYWWAVLAHCAWNVFARLPCRTITVWRPYTTEPVGMERSRKRYHAQKQKQPLAQVAQNAGKSVLRSTSTATAVKAAVDSIVDTAAAERPRNKTQTKKRRRGKSTNKSQMLALPANNIASHPTYGVNRPRYVRNAVADEYLTCLINPQVAANRGYLPKYPDRFDDKTTAQFAHITIPELKPLANTAALTGPIVLKDMRDGYLGVHVVPNLTSPVRVCGIKTLQAEETLSGYTSIQDGNFGIMSNSTSPSPGMLARQMIITGEIQQVSIPYSLDSQSDLITPPIRVRKESGELFYGYPIMFNGFTLSFTIVPDALLEAQDEADYKIYVTLVDYEDNILLSASTQVYFSRNVVTQLSPDVIFTLVPEHLFNVQFVTGAALGINRWPGFKINVRTDAPVPISVTTMTLDVECGGTLWQGWEPYQLPALDTYYSNYDKYRVVCMSALLTNTSPVISQNGVVTSALIRGGTAANFTGAYDPQQLAEFNGMYNGPAANGTYVVWHPYDDVDMSFKDVSHVDEDLPYIMALANSADAAGNTPTFRLLVFMGLEATTHSQALSVSASPVNDAAVQLAYRIWRDRGYPTATSNDLHSFIMDVANKAIGTYDKVKSVYDRIPQPVKDFAWQSLLKGVGISALVL